VSRTAHQPSADQSHGMGSTPRLLDSTPHRPATSPPLAAEARKSSDTPTHREEFRNDRTHPCLSKATPFQSKRQRQPPSAVFTQPASPPLPRALTRVSGRITTNDAMELPAPHALPEFQACDGGRARMSERSSLRLSAGATSAGSAVRGASAQSSGREPGREPRRESGRESGRGRQSARQSARRSSTGVVVSI
jgi:hypothetical protein